MLEQSRLQTLIHPVLSVCQYGLSGLDMACQLGFINCLDSFLSCCRKYHPKPKLGWEVDPDKPG